MIAIQNIVKMTTVPILSTSESTSHRSGSSKKCLKPFRTESGTAVKAKKLDKKMTSRTCPQILESFQFPPPFAHPVEVYYFAEVQPIPRLSQKRTEASGGEFPIKL